MQIPGCGETPSSFSCGSWLILEVSRADAGAVLADLRQGSRRFLLWFRSQRPTVGSGLFLVSVFNNKSVAFHLRFKSVYTCYFSVQVISQ